MATIKIKKKTGSDTASSLTHGELGATQNKIFYGNQANTAVEVARKDSNGDVTADSGGFVTGSAKIIYNATTQSIDFIFN